MVVTNHFVYAVLGGCVANVVEDRGTVGHRFSSAPGAKAIAERVHVGIGADAWISKQVPRSAHLLAPFENDKTLLGALALEMAGPADPRQPRPYDNDIHVLQNFASNSAKTSHARRY